MDGHRLKTLRLHVDIDPNVEEWNFEHVLYPLLRLRNIPKVMIRGYVPSHVRQRLIYDLKSVEPSFNTLRQWKLLIVEAQLQKQLLDIVCDVPFCDCGECFIPEIVKDLDFRMCALEEASHESCLSATCEENFIARLSLARQTLKRLDVGKLLKLIKGIKESRADTNRYESVTDDGRLEEAAKIWGADVYNDTKKNAIEEEEWGVFGSVKEPKVVTIGKRAKSIEE